MYFIYICTFSIVPSAVLCIRRAVSLSWQCLRGTSVGILTKHGTALEFCWCVGMLLSYVLLCCCYPDRHPLHSSEDTPPLSSRPCVPPGTNTVNKHTHIRHSHLTALFQFGELFSSEGRKTGEKATKGCLNGQQKEEGKMRRSVSS